jgi:hypothetical protein
MFTYMHVIFSYMTMIILPLLLYTCSGGMSTGLFCGRELRFSPIRSLNHNSIRQNTASSFTNDLRINQRCDYMVESNLGSVCLRFCGNVRRGTFGGLLSRVSPRVWLSIRRFQCVSASCFSNGLRINRRCDYMVKSNLGRV